MSGEIGDGAGFRTYEKQDKIVVGMSGGVDSSVCVKILQEQGFEVQGVVIHFSPAHEKAVEQAIVAAKQLNVALAVSNCEEMFEQEVIEPFCEAYCAGVTPSPCVMCNPRVKFEVLAKTADAMGIELIASGHYARVTEKDGIYYVQKAVSEARDQSYMLYALPQEILKRLCLPVGEFEKGDIREMAADAQLSSADAPDSQEICFIPDGDYAAYIEARGMTSKKGRFIGPNGEDLGEHKGILHYTVGQRKGLNIAYGKPVFIKRILENGDILLALAGDEFAGAITVKNAIKTNGKQYSAGERYDVKVRSRAVPAPCVIEAVDGDVLTVRFEEKQRAPAPGQAAVFYVGDLIYGGGTIVEMI